MATYGTTKRNNIGKSQNSDSLQTLSEHNESEISPSPSP